MKMKPSADCVLCLLGVFLGERVDSGERWSKVQILTPTLTG